MELFDRPNSDSNFSLTGIAALIFFVWIALMFTTPVGEGDFFWHVKTGEWIWQHKSLPTAAPFSFTVKDVNPNYPESGRIQFLLKQYWLGQLVFKASQKYLTIFRQDGNGKRQTTSESRTGKSIASN